MSLTSAIDILDKRFKIFCIQISQFSIFCKKRCPPDLLNVGKVNIIENLK